MSAIYCTPSGHLSTAGPLVPPPEHPGPATGRGWGSGVLIIRHISRQLIVMWHTLPPLLVPINADNYRVGLQEATVAKWKVNLKPTKSETPGKGHGQERDMLH